MSAATLAATSASISTPVSAVVFTFDENDKVLKKEFLFTKTGNPQHDHSSHTFVFGPDGRLLLEKRLTYPELQPVIASISQAPGSRPPNAEMNFDGLQLPLVTRDVAWDARAKHILLLLGNERTVVLDATGHELSSFFPDRDGGNLQNVSARSNGEVLVSIFGSKYPYRLGTKSDHPTTERR